VESREFDTLASPTTEEKIVGVDRRFGDLIRLTSGPLLVAIGLLIGSGVAYAGVPADPPGGATPVYPQWNNGVVNADRDSGSDTTFFVMQSIADLYTSAGLYGCTLNNGAGQTLYNTDFTATASDEGYYCQANQNIATTDTSDNWNRTEIYQGVDLVGSGNGQNQLCGQITSPLAVNFARSSKPIDTGTGGNTPVGPTSPTCATESQVGFAKDGVPVVDVQTLNPSTYGTSTASGTNDDYASIDSGKVGPVADGWLPTDAVGGPYHGTAFTNVSNADNGGGANSTAWRLWCSNGAANQINDWGALTNLGPTLAVVNATVSGGSLTAAPEASLDGAFTGSTSAITFPSNVTGATLAGTGVPGSVTVTGGGGTSTLTLSNSSFSVSNENLTLTLTGSQTEAVGQGVPDGIPVRIMGVNTQSGTEATMELYSNADAATGCLSNTDANAAGDPNTATGGGPTSGTNTHTALENNAAQVLQFAESDFPADPVDQSIEAATTLYYESNGVYNTDPYAGEADIWSTGTVGSGTSTTYTLSKVSENGKTTTTANLLNNLYPTARTLFNIYRTDTVSASTGGFLNWLCGTNGDNSGITKGIDNTDGLNYDTELNTLISTTFGFPRLTDESSEPSNGLQPADLQQAPNTTCASGLTGTSGNGDPPVTAVVNSQG
jgi:hypothetical protein